MTTALTDQIRDYFAEIEHQHDAAAVVATLELEQPRIRMVAASSTPPPAVGNRWWVAPVAAAVVVVAVVAGVVFVGPVGDDGSVVSVVPSTLPEATVLPDLHLPGMNLDEPAGEYGWTGALGSRGGMHNVVEGEEASEWRETQLVFAVYNDCFSAGGDPVSLTVAGFDGLYVEPYEDSSVTFHSLRSEDNTTGAYALPIGDRTLCVYLTWDLATTKEELAAARQVVESIRAEPFGEDGIRINFTLPARWDTG